MNIDKKLAKQKEQEATRVARIEQENRDLFHIILTSECDVAMNDFDKLSSDHQHDIQSQHFFRDNKKCSDFGTYDCQVPQAIKGRRQDIDFCIADIVAALVAANITTVGSCCGHKRIDGNIMLEDGREIIIKLRRKKMINKTQATITFYKDNGELHKVDIFYDAEIEKWTFKDGTILDFSLTDKDEQIIKELMLKENK